MSEQNKLPEDKLLESESESELKEAEKSPFRKFFFSMTTILLYMVGIIYYNGKDTSMVRFFALMTIVMLYVIGSKIDGLNKNSKP